MRNEASKLILTCHKSFTRIAFIALLHPAIVALPVGIAVPFLSQKPGFDFQVGKIDAMFSLATNATFLCCVVTEMSPANSLLSSASYKRLCTTAAVFCSGQRSGVSRQTVQGSSELPATQQQRRGLLPPVLRL